MKVNVILHRRGKCVGKDPNGENLYEGESLSWDMELKLGSIEDLYRQLGSLCKDDVRIFIEPIGVTQCQPTREH